MNRLEGMSHSAAGKEQDRTHLPLAGRTILITRTREGNVFQKRQLDELGAKVVELNTIEISSPSSWEKLDRAISILEEFDWVIFTSANGVNLFFQRCHELGRQEFLENVKSGGRNLKFACVGPATRLALDSLGFKSAFEPHEFLTRELATELLKFIGSNEKILLARAERANKEMTRIIEKSGAQIFEAPVYSTISREATVSTELLDCITDITLTSPSTVDGLLKSVSVGDITSRRIHVHCIGPVTARSAKVRGLEIHSVSRIHTLDGLAESIIQHIL